MQANAITHYIFSKLYEIERQQGRVSRKTRSAASVSKASAVAVSVLSCMLIYQQIAIAENRKKIQELDKRLTETEKDEVNRNE